MFFEMLPFRVVTVAELAGLVRSMDFGEVSLELDCRWHQQNPDLLGLDWAIGDLTRSWWRLPSSARAAQSLLGLPSTYRLRTAQAIALLAGACTRLSTPGETLHRG